MQKSKTAKILSLVFGFIGALYALLGGIFLAVGEKRMELPGLRVSGDPEVFPILGRVFLVMGVLSLLAMAAIIVISRRREKAREELLLWGTRVTGRVQDIPVDRTVRVNGRSPLRILVDVKHPLTGQQVTLRSGQVWETSLSNGDPVDVLFDPMDEKKYAVDVK